MSDQPPGELPDQSGFSANNPEKNFHNQAESVKLENGLSADDFSEVVSHSGQEGSASIEDSKFSIGESNTNPTGKVSPKVDLHEIQKEVENLNISGEELNGLPSIVVVNKETESFRNLMAYAASSDSEEEGDTTNQNIPLDTPLQLTREPLDDTSSDSESDSFGTTLFSESDSDTTEHSDEDVAVAEDSGVRSQSRSSNKGAVRKEGCKTAYEEELLTALPDLSKLVISAETEFMHIGTVSAIISECVTVLAFPNTPAFDLDSMLFICDETTQNKKPLGPIYDVLGPVSEPIYCVRFNSENDVKTAGIQSGMQVYAAPKNEGLTKFVFVRELLKMKGTDASWLNDQEQPSEQAEFSDDEEERAAKRGSNKTSGKRKLEDRSLERHWRYERTMNQCNTLNTRVVRLMDAHRRISGQIQQHSATIDDSPVTSTALDLPHFNPAVPPPGYGVYGLPGPVTTASTNDHTMAEYSTSYRTSEQPEVRWVRGSSTRRSLFNNRGLHRSSPNHHFSNNGRNFRGPGPSSQPF